MIKKYIEKIVENGKQEDMEKLSDMLSEIIYMMKELHHDKYEHYKMCLYEMAEGKKLNEDMANKWVESMKPFGKKWTMEDTNNAMDSLGYQDNRIDFFVTSNMMYNDYYDLVKDNEELALKMAHNWLNDVDSGDNKLYNYWKYVIKKD